VRSADGERDAGADNELMTVEAQRVVEKARVAMMRAAVAEQPDDPERLIVREVPRAQPRPGSALVKAEAFGLSRSEYERAGFARSTSPTKRGGCR
jgi:hypothetical protein